MSVPLEYRNLGRVLEVSADGGDLISTVNVWIKGTTADIRNLQPRQISAWVDLQSATAGERIFELTAATVQVPYGFSVIRISPSRIRLRLEEVARRMVPVMPRLEGSPPTGYSVKQSIITPTEVEIIGPESAVNSVRRVITDSIDISNLTSDVTRTVNIGVENSSVRLGKVKAVSVLLHVSEIEDMMTLRRIPVTITGNTGEVQFNPKVVRVDAQAPKRILSKLSEDNVKAVLDLHGLKSGVYELTPQITVDLPEQKQVTITGILPERIKVRIE